MKKVIVLAAVAVFSLFGVSGAFAQAANQVVALSANIAATCTLTGGAGQTAVIPVTSGVVDTTAINVTTLGTVSCNENATLTLTSANGGLTNATPNTNPGFVNRIHYQASASFNSVALTQALDTTGATGSVTTGASGATTSGPITNGNLTLSINPLAPVTGSLGIGAYSDTLTITVTPHV